MKFTPGWSVGWFFIPIASLWKPYYAMKEIYQASTTPHDWQSVADGSLVGGWWALFLISNFMGQIVFRLALSAEELDELIISTTVTMASDLLDIALTIVTLALVSRVFNMQIGHLKNEGVNT